MEDLLKRLQNEAGLTQYQAEKVMSIIKDHIEREGVNFGVDWKRFFKGKSKEFIDKADEVFSNVSENTKDYTDKFSDTMETFADKARKGAHDISQRAADFFDKKKKEDI